MNYKEISAMKEEQLDEAMKEAELELMKLKSQVATGTPPENPGQINQLRRTIARIKTKKNE